MSELIQYFETKNNPQILTNDIPWAKISMQCSLETLLKFEDQIIWYFASCNSNMSDDLIKKYQNELNWSEVSKWCSFKILIEFEHKINTYQASHNPNLYFEFIEKNKDKLVYNRNIEDILVKYQSALIKQSKFPDLYN